MSRFKPHVFAIVALILGATLNGCTGQSQPKIAPIRANVDLLSKDIEDRPWE